MSTAARASHRDRADLASVRRTNLSLILRLLAAQGPSARSELASASGLNRATVATLAADLELRGLVQSNGLQRTGVGRPGQVLRIDGSEVIGLGVQIGPEGLNLAAVDFAGLVVSDRRVQVDPLTTSAEDLLGDVAGLVVETVENLGGPSKVVGLSVAVPALVHAPSGRVDVAPHLGWSDVDLAQRLAERLGRPPYKVQVDNDANLAAAAEHAVGAYAGTDDMVVVTGAVGVGGGAYVDGRLLRGASGFAAEFGHMPIETSDVRCECGRTGCWETAVGLPALLRAAASPDDALHDPALGQHARLLELRRRADAGDNRTLRALHATALSLGRGIALLINLFDPAVVVLGGYFAALGDQLLEPVADEVGRHVVARTGGVEIAASELGPAAAAMGGAHVALDAVLDDPTLVPARDARPATASGERA